ncbi:hypothetical protein Trydic_g3297 [Trypoxylus dichotomus]
MFWIVYNVESGRQSIEDDPQLTSTDDGPVQKIKDLVRTNRHLTVRELAVEEISSCMTFLSKSCTCTEFVPSLMMKQQKIEWTFTCNFSNKLTTTNY